MELVGYDEEHTIEGVVFENVLLDGKQVVAEQVTMNDFVKGVQFQWAL